VHDPQEFPLLYLQDLYQKNIDLLGNLGSIKEWKITIILDFIQNLYSVKQTKGF